MTYQDFSFYWKIISLPHALKIIFLSLTCEDIGVTMVTNVISHLQESFPLRRAAGSFEISFTKSCLLCRNFISIYKINRTLHGRLVIRPLSSRAESIFNSYIYYSILLLPERFPPSWNIHIFVAHIRNMCTNRMHAVLVSAHFWSTSKFFWS